MTHAFVDFLEFLKGVDPHRIVQCAIMNDDAYFQVLCFRPSIRG